MTKLAEGWYADPSGTDQLRWRDGHVWTNYVEPYEASVPSSEDAEVVVPAVDEAFPTSSPEEQVVTSAGTPILMPEASPPQEVTLVSSVAETPVASISMSDSPVDEKDNNETDAPRKSETSRWVLARAASWAFVAVFITVLVTVWSYLGVSGRIQENAKSHAEIAQSELDTARLTLESTDQQLQEATE